MWKWSSSVSLSNPMESETFNIMGNLSAIAKLPEFSNVVNDPRSDKTDICVNQLIERKDWKTLHKLVIDNPSEVTKVEKVNGRLPIHRALVYNAPVQLLEAIVRFYPVAMTIIDKHGNLPFHYAILNNADYSTFLSLLTFNTECLKKADKDGQLPLHQAISRKMNDSIILLFINTYPESVVRKSKAGKHSLHYACEFNAPATIVRAILSYNMDETVGSAAGLSGSSKNHMRILSGSPNTSTKIYTGSPSASHKTYNNDSDGEGASTKSAAIRTGVTSPPVGRRHSIGNSQMSSPSTIHRKSNENLTNLINRKSSENLPNLMVVNTLSRDFFNGRLPLHIACEYRASLEVISMLLVSYPEAVKTFGTDLMYPVHYALAHKAALEVVQLLTSAFPEGLVHRDRRGRMPLHYAMERHAADAVFLYLLDTVPTVASFRGYGSPGQYPLSTAIEKHMSTAVLVKIINSFPQAAAEVNIHNVLPLRSAVKNKCEPEVIELLLSVNPSAAAAVDDFQRTALHYAVSRNNSILYVRNLVRAFPEGVRTADSNGQLPIHLAIIRQVDRVLIDYLLDQYAEGLLVPDKYNYLPLNYAIEVNAPLWLLQLLLTTQPNSARHVLDILPSAPVKTPQKTQQNYLKQIAARTNTNPNATDSLIHDISTEYAVPGMASKSSTDLTVPGRLPLHQAIEFRRPAEVLKLLIDTFPESVHYAETSRHRLPIHYAIERLLPVESLMIIHRANPVVGPKVKDLNGLLPVHYAILHHTEAELVRALLSAYPLIATSIDYPLHKHTIASEVRLSSNQAEDLAETTSHSGFSSRFYATTSMIEGLDDDDVSLPSTSSHGVQNKSNKRVYGSKHGVLNKTIVNNQQVTGLNAEHNRSMHNNNNINATGAVLFSATLPVQSFNPSLTSPDSYAANIKPRREPPVYDISKRHAEHHLLLYYAIDHNATPETVAEILLYTMPYHHSTGKLNLDHYFTWTYVVAYTQDYYSESVELLLARHYEKDTAVIKQLSDFCDLFTHRAIDIATPKCHYAILRRLYYYSRYEILTTRNMVHKTNESMLLYAVDHESNASVSYGSGGNSNGGNSNGGNSNGGNNSDQPTYNSKQVVVLKFTKNRTNFLREVQLRREVNLSPDYVIPLLASYDCDEDHLYRAECVRKGYKQWPYLMVFAAGERSLQSMILHENICHGSVRAPVDTDPQYDGLGVSSEGSDREGNCNSTYVVVPASNPLTSTDLYQEVLRTGRLLLQSVDYFHSMGLVHGDIKPSNVVRDKGALKLIDLGVASRFSQSELVSGDPHLTFGYTAPELATMYIHAIHHEQRQAESNLLNSESENIHDRNVNAVENTSSAIATRPGTGNIGKSSILSRHNSHSRSGNNIGTGKICCMRPGTGHQRPLTAPSHQAEQQHEIINKDRETNLYATDTISQAAHQRVLASRAQDMWSVGCILYLLCAKEPLFLLNVSDHLNYDQLELLAAWSDATKAARLDKVTNVYARNLLSQLLNKDPELRPSAMSCLQHPFFAVDFSSAASSNRDNAKALHNLVRFPGLKPKYDVFLCFRYKTLQESTGGAGVTDKEEAVLEEETENDRLVSANEDNLSDDDDELTQNSELSGSLPSLPRNNRATGAYKFNKENREGEHKHHSDSSARHPSQQPQQHNQNVHIADDIAHIQQMTSLLLDQGQAVSSSLYNNYANSSDNSNGADLTTINHAMNEQYHKLLNQTAHNLCNSSSMVIVLSTFALHYGTNDVAIATKLKTTMLPIDSLLYEMKLALELSALGLLERGVYLVLVGDRQKISNSNNTTDNDRNNAGDVNNFNKTLQQHALDTLDEMSVENSTIDNSLEKHSADNSGDNNQYEYTSYFRTYLGEIVGHYSANKLSTAGANTTATHSRQNPHSKSEDQQPNEMNYLLGDIEIKIADFFKQHSLGVPRYNKMTCQSLLETVLRLPTFHVVGDKNTCIANIVNMLGGLLSGEIEISNKNYSNALFNSSATTSIVPNVTTRGSSRGASRSRPGTSNNVFSKPLSSASDNNVLFINNSSATIAANIGTNPTTTGQSTRLHTPIQSNTATGLTTPLLQTSFTDSTNNHSNGLAIITDGLRVTSTPKQIVERLTSPQLASTFNDTVRSTNTVLSTSGKHQLAYRPHTDTEVASSSFRNNTLNKSNNDMSHSPIRNNTTSNIVSSHHNHSGGSSAMYTPDIAMNRISSPNNDYTLDNGDPMSPSANDVLFFDNELNAQGPPATSAAQLHSPQHDSHLLIPYFTEIVGQDKQRTGLTMSILVEKIEQKDNIIMNLEMEIALLKEQMLRQQQEIIVVRDRAKVI